jgi:SSS family solute:Na+ symporter
LDLFPSMSNPEVFVVLFLMPLLVQWWSVWYPGAEPGGGGYIAQRMFAAKNEDHSIKAVLFFNVAHYALRPWPWIIVALCSLVVFPDLESFKTAFPDSESIINHDLGYPAMLTFIPAGLLGLVVTSLIAAYMSTISTHLNWGASYIVNDFYKRFVKPEASQKEMLNLGRLITVGLMILTMLFALVLDNALSAFNILLQIGAGTGLIFILRWFWWRINAATELAAMIISFLVAIYFGVLHTKLGFDAFPAWQELLIGVGLTTVGWVVVAFTTAPTSLDKMISFINKVNPGGPGWKRISDQAAQSGLLTAKEETWKVPVGILCMVAGTIGVYSFLMGTGMIIYGKYIVGISLFVIATLCTFVIKKLWPKIN